MASIQNELNNIKTALYGKDVRTSIHNAIKICYDDASVNNDNANMEVKLARGTCNTLNDRLNESDKNQEEFRSKLEYKANKGDTITINQIDKNKGKFDQTYFTDEFLSQMAGNAPINSTVANKSITNEKLADKSICDHNISDSTFSFLIGETIKGSDIPWEVGSIDGNGFDMLSIQRIRSPYIRFNKKGIFKLKDYSKYQQNIIMYDKSFNKIGGTEWQQRDVMLQNENCYFVRILLGKLQYVEIPTSEIQTISSSFSIEPYSLIEENVRTKYLINKKNQISYGYGTFNADGSESSFFPVASVPSRIRNNRFIKINNGVISSTKFDKYKINVISYNETFEKIGSTEWVETDVVISEPCYVRFMIAHKNDSEITENDILKMSSSVELYGDIYFYNHEENITYNDLSNTSIYSKHLKEQHWQIGSLSFSGDAVVETGSLDRARSGYIKLNKGDKISCSNNEYVFGGHIFNLTDKYWIKDIGWQTTGTYIAPTDCYLRIVAKRIDEKILNFNYVDKFVKSLSFVPSYLINNKEEINYSYLNSTNYTQTTDSIVLNSDVNEINYIELSSNVRNAQIGIVEFNAKLTDINSVSSVALFRDLEKVFEISINTTYFKPYVLKIPFNDENSLFTVKIGSLTTSTKANCEIKDIKIKFEDIVTKQFDNDNLIYIAHRGDTKFAPENTFPAFMEAKLKGYNAIEVDVEVTSDSELVLLHDSTIDRTSNGTGSISSLTLEQARAYDYGSWKNSKYKGATIPTLREFLVWCRMTDIRPVLELKTAFSNEIANKFVNTLIETKMLDKCDVISFNFNALKSVADVNNNIRFALIGAPSESTIANLKSLGDNIYYSIYGSDLSSSAKLCSNHNLDYIYSTNDGNTIRECYNVGCVGICTDMLILNNCCM